MSDAQVGLLVAAPCIVVMAALLYRMGVLQMTGLVTAILSTLLVGLVTSPPL